MNERAVPMTDGEVELLHAIASAQRMLGVTSIFALSKRTGRNPAWIDAALGQLRGKGFADRPEIAREAGAQAEWRLTQRGWAVAGNRPPWV